MRIERGTEEEQKNRKRENDKQKTVKIHTNKSHQKDTFKYNKRGNWLNANGKRITLIRAE